MRSLKHCILSAAGALALTLTTTASAETQMLDKVIAIVGEGVVLQSEFKERKQQVMQRLRGQYDQLPPEDVLQQQILDQLILERLQIEEAGRYGIEISDQQVNQALQRVMANNQVESLDQLAQQLAAEGMTLEHLREKIRHDLLIQQVQQGVVNNRIRVTDQEIDNFLDSSDGKFATSPDYRLRHILISASASSGEDAVNEAREQAQDLYEQLQSGADFSQLAIAHSDDQTALEGGDLGWRKLAQLPELFSDVVSGLGVGEVSEPIRSGAGFHILKNVEQRGGGEQLVDQTKARHILIKTSEIMDDATAKETLADLKEQIENGADFAKLAKEHSEDIGSMLDGGSLGWSNPGQFVPAFENTMAKLDIGEISEPFKSQYGWHIMQVQDRRQQDMSDQVMRNKAAQMLRQRRFDEELQVWQTEIKESAYIDLKGEFAKDEDPDA